MTRDTPTDTSTDESRSRSDRPTMGGVDHTHPERNTTFGSIFGRGPSVAADGGEPATTSEAADDEVAMEDVDHEAPSNTDANAVFERGAEHADASDVAAVDDLADDADPANVPDPVDEGPTDE